MKKIQNKQKFDPPKPTTGDTAYLVTKALLSPIIGATELFERFVGPPLQKRTEKWMEEVAQALRYLEENQGIKLETLQGDERFITIVTQATIIAVRNHQQEKLDALRNAIINSATNPNLEEDIHLTFIRFIEELTPSHLALLKFFVSREDDLKLLTSYPSIYQLISSSATGSLPKDQFKMLIGDLNVRGLIWISQDIEDFEDIYQAEAVINESTNDNLPRIIVTDISKDFLEFISNNQ